MKHPISRTLITAAISITIAAMAMSFAISALNIEKLVTDLASEKLTNRLTNVSTQVESWYDSVNVAFQELTNEFYKSPHMTIDEKTDVIYDAYRAFPSGGYLYDLYAGFPDKGFISSTGFIMPADYDPTSRDWYKLACEHPGETVITPAYIDDHVRESWCITVARTIHPKDGSLGVLAADYTQGSLNKLLSRINMGSANIIILQNDGNLITHPDVDSDVNSHGIIESLATLDNNSYEEFYDTLKAKVGSTFRLTVKGSDNYYACRKIGNGWYVLAYESASAFRRPLYETVVLLLIVSCTSILGIIITMVIVTNSEVGKPLRKLTTAIREFSIDDTVSFAGVEIDANNELKILTETLKSMELRMREAYNKAHTDYMTGLRNREYFYAKVSGDLEKNRHGPLHAFFIIDLDKFKSVNDTYGHHTGDEVIVGCAAKLKEIFSSHGDIAARIGGDEFSAFMGIVNSVDEVHERCERINAAFAEVVYGDGLRMTGSIGVVITESDVTYEKAFDLADNALYVVKENGRNGWHIINNAADN